MLQNNYDSEVSKGNLNEDKAIAKLEEEIEKLDQKIRTERLISILAITILFNSICFTRIESWSGPIVIGIIELLFFIVIADKLQIETITGIIDQIFNVFNKNNKE